MSINIVQLHTEVYKDVITYVPDVLAFRTELQQYSGRDFVHFDKISEKMVLSCGQSPRVLYLENKSLAICRVSPQQYDFLNSLTTLEIIGEDTGLEQFHFFPGGDSKYNSVYSTEPYDIKLQDGSIIQVQPPYKFASFYGERIHEEEHLNAALHE